MAKRTGDTTQAEEEFLRALRSQVTRQEIILTSVRITDPREGDVESATKGRQSWSVYTQRTEREAVLWNTRFVTMG